jgi:hypothetical protein
MEAMVHVQIITTLASSTAAALHGEKKESEMAMPCIAKMVHAFYKYIMENEGLEDTMNQTMSICMTSFHNDFGIIFLNALVHITGCDARNLEENHQICFFG